MILVSRAQLGARCALALVVALPLACALSEDPISTRPYANAGAPTSGGALVSSGGSSVSQGGRGVAFISGGSGSTAGGAASGGANPGSGGATGSSGGAAGSSGGNAAKGGSAGASGSAGRGGGASGGISAGKGGTGGAASGGAASGGASPKGGTGGAAMGGAASGGTASGGAAMGGTASGGSAGTPGCGVCLVHRYSFTGSGTQVTDSVGTAHGTAVNTTLASGAVPLSGTTSDQYVSLPAGVLSGLSSATIEAWVTWSGGAAWQRLFDFGDNSGTSAGAQGPEGVTYLFVSPKAVNNTTGLLRVAYSLSGPSGEVMFDASTALPSATMTHVAVVIDDPADTLSLYLNGATAGSTTLTSPLSSIRSVNNWLGRSQFQADPEFGGQIHEFRIYGSARTSAQIQASSSAGPEIVPTN